MLSKLFISSLFATVAFANTMHLNSNFGKCMDVRGGVFANGTPVQIFDCNGTPAQQWTFNPGFTKVQVTGTNFCLDAGSNPADFVGMKIWTCFDNLPAQNWVYTFPPGKLQLAGTDLCLDLPNGNTTNGNQLQTFECTNGNTNQVWLIEA